MRQPVNKPQGPRVRSVLAGLLLAPALHATPQPADPPDDPPAIIGDAPRDEPNPTKPDTPDDVLTPMDPLTGPVRPRPGFFARQFALADELAGAVRLRSEIDEVLVGQDKGDGDDHPSMEARLAGFAVRCEVLADHAQADHAKAILLSCEARVNAALVYLQDPAMQRVLASRLAQLRSAAQAMRGLSAPHAQTDADYWELVANLAQAAHLQAGVEARQALAEKLLGSFIQTYKDEPSADDYVVDARLSLAQVLDDRGDQAGVRKQLEQVGELPSDSPRAEQARLLRASVARIGKKVRIEGVTTRVSVWKLSDFAGQPVLLHLYADAVEPSVAMIQTIREAIEQGKLGGAAVASLRIGESIEGAPSTPWPTLPIDLEPGGVLERLGVTELPALVWIDAQGRIASIGHTAATLDQMPGHAAEDTPGPDSQPDPASKTGAESPPQPGSDTPVEPEEK